MVDPFSPAGQAAAAAKAASAEENLIDCDMEESGDANAAAAAGSEVPLVT